MKHHLTNSQAEIMMIRQCKRNRHSEQIMKRIAARQYALPEDYTRIEHVINSLFDIVEKYNLIKDWRRFVVRDLNPDHDKIFFREEPKGYKENLFEKLVCVICHTEAKVFDNYPSPAYFRNRHEAHKAKDSEEAHAGGA